MFNVDCQPTATATQVRDKSTGDVRYYAPNRDIAYLGPHMLRHALVGFSEFPNPDAVYATVLAASGLSAEQQRDEMCKIARDLATCIKSAVDEKQSSRLEQVVNDLTQLRTANPAVLCALLAKIGELMIGATFAGLLDITPSDGEPPNIRSIEALVEFAGTITA